MAEEVTSGEVRTRQFDIVRKGYDRTQVDEFLASVARRIDHLEESIDGADRAAIALGLDDAEALARELNTIGGEVGAILEAARAAAEGMRSRATADAKALQASSQEASSSMLSEATEQSHSMRAAAWNEGSSMLQSALAQVRALVDEAKEEALFIRAEAEREAIRHVGDAKRDRDAMIGEARIEADQILEAARAESDGVLAAANQAAELAQERARALEDRRSELLTELETARASIGHLETEIESKRQELEVPEVPEVLDLAEAEDRTHHSPDGGSVKIVAASKVVPLNPVDADSFVAEVEALHRREAEVLPDEPTVEEVETVTVISPTPVVSDSPPDDQPEPDLHVVPTPESVPEPEADDRRQMSDDRPAEPEPEADDRPAEAEPEPEADDRRQMSDDRPAEPEPEADDRPAEAEPEPEPEADDRRQMSDDRPAEAEPEPEVDDRPAEAELEREPVDDLGSLFAQLRSGVDAGPTSTADEHPEPPVAEVESPPQDTAPQTPPAPADGRKPTAESGTQDESPAAPSLIPAQNAALRTIKRSLVDLQNDTLEHLRSQDGWLPDEAFTDRFSEPFAELASAVGAPDDKGAASAFGTDLYDSVTSAIERARDAGSGERAVAAAASKVFRTWRSDEAERRVVTVATSLSQETSTR